MQWTKVNRWLAFGLVAINYSFMAGVIASILWLWNHAAPGHQIGSEPDVFAAIKLIEAVVFVKGCFFVLRLTRIFPSNQRLHGPVNLGFVLIGFVLGFATLPFFISSFNHLLASPTIPGPVTPTILTGSLVVIAINLVSMGVWTDIREPEERTFAFVGDY